MPKVIPWTNDIEPGDVVMWRSTKNFFIVTKVEKFKPVHRWERAPRKNKNGDLPLLLTVEKACNRYGAAPKTEKGSWAFNFTLRTNQVQKMTIKEATDFIAAEIKRMQDALPKIAEVLEHQSRLKRASSLK